MDSRKNIDLCTFLQLQPDQVAEMVEEVMSKHEDSPQVRVCVIHHLEL